MAGDWIKIEHTTPDKPEVWKMADLLNKSPDVVFARLVRIWIWADQQSMDGQNLGVIDEMINHIAKIKDFATAMRAVGWLTGKAGSISFPQFNRHNGTTAKRRAEDARRKGRDRKTSEKCPKKTGQNVRIAQDKMKTREEKRREEKNKTEPPHPLAELIPSSKAKTENPPAALDTPEFLSAWADYVDYRREKRLKPLLPRSVNLKWEEMAAHGLAASVAALRECIANGWHAPHFHEPQSRRSSNGRISPADAMRQVLQKNAQTHQEQPNDEPETVRDVGALLGEDFGALPG